MTIKKENQNNLIESLVQSEIKSVLKEYFYTTQEGRQNEVQDFLSSRLERSSLQEFIKNPKKGLRYVRENHTERFYWWANEDIENLFKYWRSR